MNKTYLITLALALALVVVCIRLAMAGRTSSVDASQAVIDNIMTRTSIRSYTDKPVEAHKVETLLRAGMAAPSAMNKQPWHFVVVTNKEMLARIAQATPNARMAATAPLAIVVCGDLSRENDDWTRDYWVQDASAATQNILLAAHGLGLGAVWTGTYPSEERCAKVSELLALPSHLIPLGTIVIGYPDESPAPKDKWKAENVSYETYGGQTPDTTAATAATATAVEVKKEFRDIDLTRDFRDNAFSFFTGAGVLVAAGDKAEGNAMTIGWGGLGTLWGGTRSTITVYVAEKRYTHTLLEKAKYFTIMTFADKNVLLYMGKNSGRDGDKAASLGLTKLYTDNGTPYYAEADMVIECRIMYRQPFDPRYFTDDVPKNFYAKFPAGLHSMYIGEVVKAMRKE